MSELTHGLFTDPDDRDPDDRDPDSDRDPGDRDPGDRDPGDRDPGDRDPGDGPWTIATKSRTTHGGEAAREMTNGHAITNGSLAQAGRCGGG